MLHGLNVLRLNAVELRELIQEQLVENPAIELPDPGDTLGRAEAERALWDDYSRSSPEGRGGAYGREDSHDPVELAASPESLADHLSLQLDLEELTPAQRRIGAVIIGSLDGEGYLRESIDKLAELTATTATEVKAVLEVVQGFDPAGIAARDLGECLLMQMDADQASSLPGRIVRDCLPLLARGAHCEIAQALSAGSNEVKEAILLIRELNPSPGAAFDNAPSPAAVIPDVFIRIANGGPVVLANSRVTPSLSVSRACQRMAADPETGTVERRYIRERIRRATELIREVEQRRLTLTEVARAIAETQQEFFQSGPERLRPACLEDVATRLDVHISTVSRAIQGKFLSTAFGIFEFKYFFPSGCATADGRSLAAPAIKQYLGELIGSEDNARPLSDDKLCRMLSGSGIRISRRTVAKYREEMGLPSSYERRDNK